MNSVSKLLEISSPAIARPPSSAQDLIECNEVVKPGGQLMNLLSKKNGFYAFESALHVFALGDVPDPECDVIDWNKVSIWKGGFSQDLSNIFCFAENIFGEQFCIIPEGIGKFDPETADIEILADSMEQWAKLILEEFNFYTGFALSHAWQAEFGSLRPGYRLIPKKPFVLGGEFEVANLYAVEAIKGMRSRASIANQIHDLPEGARVMIQLSNENL